MSWKMSYFPPTMTTGNGNNSIVLISGWLAPTFSLVRSVSWTRSLPLQLVLHACFSPFSAFSRSVQRRSGCDKSRTITAEKFCKLCERMGTSTSWCELIRPPNSQTLQISLWIPWPGLVRLPNEYSRASVGLGESSRSRNLWIIVVLPWKKNENID
jgi:hypothetical protein